MAGYERIYWEDEPSTNTPISAENLNKMDLGIANCAAEGAEHTTQIETMDARIDEIVALPDGSTTADAELVDIRVGAGGNTYNSAGTAVRTQIKRLASVSDTQPSDPSNRIWIKGDSEEVEIPTMAEFNEVKADLNTLKDGTEISIPTVYDSTWEDGGINWGSGANSPSNYRIRQTDWVVFSNIIEETYVNVSVAIGRLYMIYQKQNGGDTRNTGWISFNSGVTSVPVISDYRYRWMYELDGTTESDTDWGEYVSIVYSNTEYPSELLPNMLTDIEGLKNYTTLDELSISFEDGAINGGNGADAASDTRIRSEYFSVPNGAKIVVQYGISIDYFKYTLSGGGYTYVNVTSGWKGENTDKTEITIDADNDISAYYRFMVQWNDSFPKEIVGKLIRIYVPTEFDTVETAKEYKETTLKNNIKKIVTMGDSMFLAGNGNLKTSWQQAITDCFGISTINVGIGGSGFLWVNNSRYDLPNDFVIGDNLPASAGVNTTDSHNAAFCSWYRISNTIPKDADLIIVGTGTNDVGQETLPDDLSDTVFIPNSTTDLSWSESDEYSAYGGDYDLTKRRGAILSCIMKLQAQAPNAKIVLLNFPNTRGTTGQNGTSIVNYEYQKTMLDALEWVHKYWGVQLIDLCGTCGINPLNRRIYVADAIHPNGLGYYTKIGSVIVGALKNILFTED